jgi:hypothetical protein
VKHLKIGENMSQQRNKIDIDILLYRYHQSPREEKSKILDELCDLHGYNRKYLLQCFNCLTGKKHVRRGRKKTYDPKSLLPALKNIWLSSDQICSKKLKAAMPNWLPFYDGTFGALEKSIKSQLLKISAATIDRLLKSSGVKYKRHGLTGTKPGYLLKNQIPIKTDHWDVKQPGFLEADTVAH